MRKVKLELPAENINDQRISDDPRETDASDNNAGHIVPFCRDQGEVVPVGMDEIIVCIVDMSGPFNDVGCNIAD